MDHLVTDGPGDLVVVEAKDGRIFGPYLSPEDARKVWEDCYPDGEGSEWEITGLYTLTPGWAKRDTYHEWYRDTRRVDPVIVGGSTLVKTEP